MKNPGQKNGSLQPVTTVLVTDQFRCQRLITAGRQLADREHTALSVINVAAAGVERNPEAIEFLFQVSRGNDAVMTIHYSDQPEKLISELLRDQCPCMVVTGLPQQQGSLLQKIWMRFDKISFFTVDHDGKIKPVTIADRVIA